MSAPTSLTFYSFTRTDARVNSSHLRAATHIHTESDQVYRSGFQNVEAKFGALLQRLDRCCAPSCSATPTQGHPRACRSTNVGADKIFSLLAVLQLTARLLQFHPIIIIKKVSFNILSRESEVSGQYKHFKYLSVRVYLRLVFPAGTGAPLSNDMLFCVAGTAGTDLLMKYSSEMGK